MLHRCSIVRDALVRDGLYDGSDDLKTGPVGPDAQPPADQAVATRWRIAPGPLLLPPHEAAFLQSLGRHLLAFYRALNRLYQESLRGAQPGWVAGYLDQGKPESLLTYSRMKRFRDLTPTVIRPDIMPTDGGMVITELDSVPGGIGLTAALGRAYGGWPMADGHTDAAHQPSAIVSPPFKILGGADGMVQGFARMLRAQIGDRVGCVGIVVSEEARDYRPEMAWMAARLREQGLDAYCLEPRDLRFTEEALFATIEGRDRPVALVYRFFELFDLKNVPKAELVMYSAKKDRVLVTPPFKPALEEKLAFALFHHPILASFWKRELGDESYPILTRVLPRTWVLDPSPLPPSAIIPDLRVGGRAVADWRDLAGATQKDRHYVVKPSGFSELAWGSRGVSVGHDLPQSEWAGALDKALASFPATPYILQEFHKGRQFESAYYDARTDDVVPMAGRARLSPYYFVAGDRVELAGILATICTPEKKLIHGMKDAIMVPCAVDTAAEKFESRKV
ncbi:MAG: hypothetical protein EPO61_10205 [Nitrospirae bacterium]|nr:MAG: hypothetical protein EPO61_10205 [Nitrospirota bacterium]